MFQDRRHPVPHAHDDLIAVVRYPRFLDNLDPGERGALVAQALPKLLGAGELVFCQSEPVDNMHILQMGCVKAYHTTPDGQAITFAYWRDGMLMGTPGVSGKLTHLWTAEALTPSRLLLIRRDRFLEFLDASANAAKCMIEILEFKARYLSQLVQILGTASVLDRLRIVLTNLSEVYGTGSLGGVRIDLPLTHAAIADMVGASRQWVTTSLKQLERAGEIRVEDRRIVVLSATPAPLSPT